MFDKINDSSWGLSIENQVFSFIQKLIGEGVLGSLENLVDFDWIGFVVIFDSEKEDCWEDEAEDGTGEKDTTTECAATHGEFCFSGAFLSGWDRSLDAWICNWFFLFFHF